MQTNTSAVTFGRLLPQGPQLPTSQTTSRVAGFAGEDALGRTEQYTSPDNATEYPQDLMYAEK